MNDLERIKQVLDEHGVHNKALANDLLQLVIEISGERLLIKERVRATLYKALLEQKVIKPEYYKTIYELMKKAEGKLK